MTWHESPANETSLPMVFVAVAADTIFLQAWNTPLGFKHCPALSQMPSTRSYLWWSFPAVKIAGVGWKLNTGKKWSLYVLWSCFIIGKLRSGKIRLKLCSFFPIHSISCSSWSNDIMKKNSCRSSSAGMTGYLIIYRDIRHAFLSFPPCPVTKPILFCFIFAFFFFNFFSNIGKLKRVSGK